MGSTVEDKYMIISLRDNKGNEATRLCEMFSKKRWNVNGLKTLIKKLITLTLSIDYQVLGIHDRPTCTSVADQT